MANVYGDLLLINAEAEGIKTDVACIFNSESFCSVDLRSSLLLLISTDVVSNDWERLEFITFCIYMYVVTCDLTLSQTNFSRNIQWMCSSDRRGLTKD